MDLIRGVSPTYEGSQNHTISHARPEQFKVHVNVLSFMKMTGCGAEGISNLRSVPRTPIHAEARQGHLCTLRAVRWSIHIKNRRPHATQTCSHHSQNDGSCNPTLPSTPSLNPIHRKVIETQLQPGNPGRQHVSARAAGTY